MNPVPKPVSNKKTYSKKTFKAPKITTIESNPLEEVEQITVVDWLSVHNIRFHASPNGGLRHPVVAMRMKRMGCSPGFPDIMIFDRPRIVENGLIYVGAAIEMKRRKGGKVSPEQREWIEALKELGWACCIARGCDEAIEFLKELGYDKRP